MVKDTERKYGLGYDIMNATIKAVQKEFNTVKITISAQVYLTNFYNNLDFEKIGEEYLEDGIPHIEMIRN